MFEYGKKGLVHALVHVRELIETGGHHGAFCTCLAEAGHKLGIKRAAQFSRIYKSYNTTQEGMLKWVLRQTLFSDVFSIHERHEPVQRREVLPASRRYKFAMPLCYADDWRDVQTGMHDDLPAIWRSTFLSKEVLVSREELLVLLRHKLQMNPTRPNLQRICKNLKIRCYGSLISPITPDEPCKRRKVVGVDSTTRRDFVRLKGVEENTALACQVGGVSINFGACLQTYYIRAIIRVYKLSNPYIVHL